jgi:GT2 family glycosyltransferase
VQDSAGDRFAITPFHTQVFRIGAGENVNKYNKKQEVFSACAGAALYKKEFFDKVGHFDEDFFAFQEDIDISFRAQLQGYKCLFLPKAVVYHMRGGTAKSKSYWHVYYGYRNHIWLLVKNLPTVFFIRYFRQTIFFIFVKLFFDMLFWLFSFNSKNYKPKVMSRIHSFVYLGKIIIKRKPIQSSRNIDLSALIKLIKK